MTQRCNWVSSEALAQYHDTEWGVPSREDQHLFEMLVLEGAQAGLSWSTILNKRAGYRRAFADFDIDKVARFTPQHVDTLVADEGIVRHRGKIESAITNARAEHHHRARRTDAHLATAEGEGIHEHRRQVGGVTRTARGLVFHHQVEQ